MSGRLPEYMYIYIYKYIYIHILYQIGILGCQIEHDRMSADRMTAEMSATLSEYMRIECQNLCQKNVR